MSKNKKGRSEKKFIDELIQASFGMDQDGNLKEYYDAKGHLNDFPRLQASSNEFDLIVDRIELLNITPQIERRAPVRYHLVMRPVLVAVILIAAVLGLGIVASATKYHVYRGRVVEADNDNVVWNNDDNLVKTSAILEAYDVIQNELGIKTLELTYLPKGMKFIQVDIQKAHATMAFSYNDKKIFFDQAKSSSIKKSDNYVSDHNKRNKIYNVWLKTTFVMGENQLDNGMIEYDATAEIEGAIYHLYGIIEDKNTFIEMVKAIDYYRK